MPTTATAEKLERLTPRMDTVQVYRHVPAGAATGNLPPNAKTERRFVAVQHHAEHYGKRTSSWFVVEPVWMFA